MSRSSFSRGSLAVVLVAVLGSGNALSLGPFIRLSLLSFMIRFRMSPRLSIWGLRCCRSITDSTSSGVVKPVLQVPQAPVVDGQPGVPVGPGFGPGPFAGQRRRGQAEILGDNPRCYHPAGELVGLGSLALDSRDLLKRVIALVKFVVARWALLGRASRPPRFF